MKKILFIIIPIIAGFLIFFLLRSNNMQIDSSFATSALLKYHYINKNLDVAMTDDNDIRVLKEILKGNTYTDNPSCGFSIDISVTLTDGQKSITFCPACDDCPIIRINESDNYIRITDEQRKLLDVILSKYGMAFPCV